MNTTPLGPSWKPKLAGILTPIVPILLWATLTQWLKLSEETSTAVSGAVLAMLVSYGLVNAKQTGVTNSPIPLIDAHAASTATIIAVAPPNSPQDSVDLSRNPAAAPPAAPPPTA